MARQKRQGPGGPHPPAPGGKKAPGMRNPMGYAPRTAEEEVAETQAHADEVRALHGGQDIVERPTVDAEQRPAAFDRHELQVVRSWAKRRPLEPNRPAPAMIDYPRMWTTKRGRYCRFKAPGGGNYALIRARPTF